MLATPFSRILRFSIAALIVSCACTLGCKPSANKIEVTGTVTYKGRPLSAGIIIFEGEDGAKEQTALNKDGVYAFNKMKPGHMKVYFEMPVKMGSGPSGPPKGAKFEPPGGLPGGADKANFDPKNMPGGAGGDAPSIPNKYTSPVTSGLSAEIKSGKNAGVNFDLTD